MTRFAILALVALPAATTIEGRAADPTFDELIAAQKARLKAKAELEKAITEGAEKLRTLHAEYQRQLADLGVIAPGPPPPAPPPKPVDQLKQKLRAAFEADAGGPADAMQLAALYREAAKLAQSPDVPSTAELLRRVREAGTSLVGPESLKGLRQVVAAELRAALGKSSDEPLTADERTAAATLFAKLAAILEGFE